MAGLLKDSWVELTSWLSGSKKSSDERRVESRLPGHGLARIRWADAAGAIRTAETHLINVSTGGFEVRAHEPIEIGAEIEIHGPMGWTANGVVVHSRPDHDEYLVGGSADWKEVQDQPEQGAPQKEVNAGV